MPYNTNTNNSVDIDFCANIHQEKFERLNNEICVLMDKLKLTLSEKWIYSEVETILERCEISMKDLRALIDKIEYM